MTTCWSKVAKVIIDVLGIRQGPAFIAGGTLRNMWGVQCPHLIHEEIG